MLKMDRGKAGVVFGDRWGIEVQSGREAVSLWRASLCGNVGGGETAAARGNLGSECYPQVEGYQSVMSIKEYDVSCVAFESHLAIRLSLAV